VKKLIAILVVMMLVVGLFAGCGGNNNGNNDVEPPCGNECDNGIENGAENGTDNAQTDVDPQIATILELMIEYAQTEQRAPGVMLREKFRTEPELFLKAMVVNERQGRGNDATLMLLGSHIAYFRQENHALYAQYATALERLENADLDEDSARMLGFIHANIEHAYNQ